MTSSSTQHITRTPARGHRGAVAAARQVSVDAGLAMLEAGGTAVDAAVAAGLVAGVVEPMETTLAGSGFLVVAEGDGTAHSVEFGPRAPAAARPDMYEVDEGAAADRGLGVSTVVGDANVTGALAAGIPGTIAGLLAAHDRFGRLDRQTVLAPAVRAAYDGFPADEYYLVDAVDNLAALRRDPGAREVFLAGGDPFPVPHLGTATLGTTRLVRQPALGRILEIVADRGHDGFYAGEVAADLVSTVRELGGRWTEADLAGRQVSIGTPLRLTFRDVDVWAPVAPSGGLTELQLLNVWQALLPERDGRSVDDPQRLRQLAEASWHCFADRYHWLGDPNFVPVPSTELLGDPYAAELAELVRTGAAPPVSTPAEGFPWQVFARRAVHDPWRHGGREGPTWQPGGATTPTAGTTHVSAIDGDGMTVSLTHTAANHFGAKVVCQRTGLLLDAAMGWFNAYPDAANSIAGGARPLANMGPVVLTRNGRPTAAVGAPGGRRIVDAVVQLVQGIVDRSLSAGDVVLEPRIDASGSAALVSERLGAAAEAMAAAGLPVKVVQEQHSPYGYELGRPVVVTRDADAGLTASTDPIARGAAGAL
ncbi:MAG: hypothetical protein GEV07_04160 [Streptosporangiales bacterium]|nr:hypothetical protein [Streptosporangiales bacterium]